MYICIIKMLLIKNMVEKKLFAKTLPVLLGFFRNGFLRHCRQYSSILLLPKETFHTSTDH